MNCYAVIIQWGIHTGNKTLRDLGIFMYVNEARAIEQYWFDVDDVVFPAAYSHNAIGMLWSNGGAYGTWFSSEPGAIHGINILPIAAGSLYLGRRPDHIVKNFAEGGGGQWQDLFLQYLAFADGDQAAAKYGTGIGSEGGDSKPHATLQIKSLQAMGKLNPLIGASVPSFAVFEKSAVRTYTAYNASDAAAIIIFTDGFQMEVPARAQATKQGPVRAISVLGRSRLRGGGGGGLLRNGVGYLAGYLGFPQGTAIYDLGGRLISGALGSGGSGGSGASSSGAEVGNTRLRAYQGDFLAVPVRK
jgi:hypothetical protein